MMNSVKWSGFIVPAVVPAKLISLHAQLCGKKVSKQVSKILLSSAISRKIQRHSEWPHIFMV